MKRETRQAIQLYCETGTYLATHPDLPDQHYDVLVEQAARLRETFSFDELMHYHTRQVMNPLLLATIIRVFIHLCIALTGLMGMVVFVEHQPDSGAGMWYVWLWCTPVLALFTALMSGLAIRDYLSPELEEEEDYEG